MVKKSSKYLAYIKELILTDLSLTYVTLNPPFVTNNWPKAPLLCLKGP